jgi:hypothetical protein
LKILQLSALRLHLLAKSELPVVLSWMGSLIWGFEWQSPSYQTSQIGYLLRLHSNTNDRLTSIGGSHHGSNPAVD